MTEGRGTHVIVNGGYTLKRFEITLAPYILAAPGLAVGHKPGVSHPHQYCIISTSTVFPGCLSQRRDYTMNRSLPEQFVGLRLTRDAFNAALNGSSLEDTNHMEDRNQALVVTSGMFEGMKGQG